MCRSRLRMNMNLNTLIEEFSQVSNALAVLSIAVTVVASWWLFYIQRKIGATATASLPLFWLDSSKLPFFIHVTNTNSRQFKIDKIGFQIFGRYTNRTKSCSNELILDVELLGKDKFLITEGDSIDLPFDGYEIGNQLAASNFRAGIQLTSPELKIWLYLTHGSRVAVEPDPKLVAKIISFIIETMQRFRQGHVEIVSNDNSSS